MNAATQETIKTFAFNRLNDPQKKLLSMNLLTNPLDQPGFGRANPRRAFYAAEKIERTHYKPAKHHYQNNDMKPAERPDAMDAFACPTRMGDVLYYRSGEVKFDVIPHNPKPVYAVY